MSFTQYSFRLIVFTIILSIITALLNYLVPFFSQFGLFSWLSLVFFFLLTLLTGFIALNGVNKNTGYGFVSRTNGVVVLKLFLSVIFLITYVVITQPVNAFFVTTFFFFYVTYTVFEVQMIVRAQRSKDRMSKVNE